MPIYEYECPEGHKFELRRGFAESDEDVKCPECKSGKVKRVFSTFGIGSSSGASCAPSAPT